jgi:hypothetical protein
MCVGDEGDPVKTATSPNLKRLEAKRTLMWLPIRGAVPHNDPLGMDRESLHDEEDEEK